MARFDQIMPLFATIAIAACAPVPLQMPEAALGPVSSSAQWAEENSTPGKCSVRVVFGSFATGPDRGAMLAINRILVAEPAMTQISRSPYGREGEHSLCIQASKPTAATRIFEDLKSALRGPVAAPVTILGPGQSVVVPNLSHGKGDADAQIRY